jgi:hypothetical protein
MAISNTLVDLNVFPISGIPVQPQSAKGVLKVFGLILEQLRKVAHLTVLILSPAGASTAMGHPNC